jgi:molybdate/tungstate transport system substrate-binding protein
MPLFRSSNRRLAAAFGIACLGLAAAACGSSPSSSSTTTPSASASSPSPSASSSSPLVSGTASVAYASSLEYINEKVIAPAFSSVTGAQYSGRGAASGTLEQEVAAGEITPNVLEVIGGDNITPLEPKYTRWYVAYAGTKMVLAYNPNSKYASQFKAIADGKQPLSSLFTLLQTPGLKLGRTDPNTDPQGRNFIYMLELAQNYYHLPSDTVSRILGTSDFGTASSSQIYAESALDSTLQSGQLDAASAYINQAVQLHLAYIPLPPQINLGDAAYKDLYKTASVTIKGGTKHGSPQVIDITIIGTPTPASIAFVAYQLSSAGLDLYKAGGFTLITPTLTGSKSDVPGPVASELGS